MNFRIEAITHPVADIDRAKAFSERAGWNLNVDREQALGYGLVAALVAAWWFFSLSPAILIGVGGLLGILGRHAGA